MKIFARPFLFAVNWAGRVASAAIVPDANSTPAPLTPAAITLITHINVMGGAGYVGVSGSGWTAQGPAIDLSILQNDDKSCDASLSASVTFSRTDGNNLTETVPAVLSYVAHRTSSGAATEGVEIMRVSDGVLLFSSGRDSLGMLQQGAILRGSLHLADLG